MAKSPGCVYNLVYTSRLASGSAVQSLTVIWLLILILLLLALFGGIFVSKLLFIVLLVALVLAVAGAR